MDRVWANVLKSIKNLSEDYSCESVDSNLSYYTNRKQTLVYLHLYEGGSYGDDRYA